MYRRYQPGYGMQPPKQGKPPAGEMGRMPRQPQKQERTQRSGSSVKQTSQQELKPSPEEKSRPQNGNPILSMLPEALYNRETKKILGVISAEDLLLAALIFLLLDSQEGENSVLVYLLLYILLSDYIDLPF